MTDEDIVQETLGQKMKKRKAEGVVEGTGVKIKLNTIGDGYRLSCFVPTVGVKSQFIETEAEANERFEALKEKYNLSEDE